LHLDFYYTFNIFEKCNAAFTKLCSNSFYFRVGTKNFKNLYYCLCLSKL